MCSRTWVDYEDMVMNRVEVLEVKKWYRGYLWVEVGGRWWEDYDGDFEGGKVG